VFVAAGTCLPSICLATIEWVHICTQTGGRDLWNMPWGGLGCHDICTKFHKNWFSIQKLIGRGGGGTQTHRENGNHMYLLVLFKNVECRLKMNCFEFMYVAHRLGSVKYSCLQIEWRRLEQLVYYWISKFVIKFLFIFISRDNMWDVYRKFQWHLAVNRARGASVASSCEMHEGRGRYVTEEIERRYKENCEMLEHDWVFVQ
jgi:hypothetical protein